MVDVPHVKIAFEEVRSVVLRQIYGLVCRAGNSARGRGPTRGGGARAFANFFACYSSDSVVERLEMEAINHLHSVKFLFPGLCGF